MNREDILARLARRRASVERANTDDRLGALSLSMAERGEALSEACAAAMAILCARSDKAEVERLLWEREPPHPSYEELKRRLRAEGQAG